MEFHWMDWLNLFLRWTHLLTGIAWIGSSFYFVWLDSHLTAPETHKPDVEGELWMVHSGGFYLVERKLIGPGTMPKVLHWFKYEALFTWMTGFFLLGVIYFFTGGAFLVDPSVAQISSNSATALALGTLLVSWFVYDALWQSSLGQKNPTLASAVSLVLAAGVGILFCKTLSGRAAFIHFGAMFGTLMVANVWVRILPAQQKMIDATKEGKKPDFSLSGKAKRRSIHNSYMTFPVLFMMLSNHYPNTFGHRYNWVVLILLVILGMAIRHYMIAMNATRPWAVIPAAAALVALVTMTATQGSHAGFSAAEGLAPVSFAQVQSIVTSRCVACHAVEPSIKTFGPSPGGVHFDSPERIAAMAERIKFRVVQTKTMPLANLTQITDEERTVIGHWIDQGARTDR